MWLCHFHLVFEIRQHRITCFILFYVFLEVSVGTFSCILFLPCFPHLHWCWPALPPCIFLYSAFSSSWFLNTETHTHTHTSHRVTHHPSCVYSCSPDWDDTQCRACDLHGGSDLRLALISDLVSIRCACQGLQGAFHAVIEKLKGS